MAAKKTSRVTANVQPTEPTDMGRFMQEVVQASRKLAGEDRAVFEYETEKAFPDGFSHRDEANALVALVFRNGPIENLHAGKHSPLLEDDTLSRFTDEEMKVIMLYATRILAAMLSIRDNSPLVYRRYLKKYGSTYCRLWERK